MLARGATAEVLPGDEDRGLGIVRRMQHKITNLVSVDGEAPVVKKELAESGALDPLQELLGDDLIGVHVNFVERDNDSGVLAKRLHRFLTFLSVERLSYPWNCPSPDDTIETSNFVCR